MSRLNWLLIAILLAAAAYAGYWFYGRHTLEAGISSALDEVSQSQLDVSYDDWSVKGFPSRFDTTFDAPYVRDPETGIGWAAPWIQIFALAYKPNEVIAYFPAEQTIEFDDTRLTLDTNDMRASIKVSATPTLPFESATLEAQNPRLRDAESGAELAMARLLAAARAAPETEADYDLYLDAQTIVLPEWMRELLDPGSLFPALIRQVRLDSTVSLSNPIDRTLTENDTINVVAASLKELGVIWGDMSISVIGDIYADVNGFAEGSLNLSAANWRRIFDMAIASGAIEKGLSDTYALFLTNLDETPQIADTLTLTLSFSEGVMRLGPMRVGDAPRLIPPPAE